MALEDGDLSGEIFKDWKDEVKKALPKTLEKKAATRSKILAVSQSCGDPKKLRKIKKKHICKSTKS